mmetsp:Transcript_15771/g.42407  ORF Transcript_15771/g.42407 Transcript_15771/m.42407 type:complete len:95 (-) Transcript_15771:900-1184(-)
MEPERGLSFHSGMFFCLRVSMRCFFFFFTSVSPPPTFIEDFLEELPQTVNLALTSDLCRNCHPQAPHPLSLFILLIIHDNLVPPRPPTVLFGQW